MGSRKGTEWTTNFEKPLMPRADNLHVLGLNKLYCKFQVVTNCIYLHEDTIETLFTNNKKVVKKYVLTITGDGLLTSITILCRYAFGNCNFTLGTTFPHLMFFKFVFD
jgi:hypothetical protein